MVYYGVGMWVGLAAESIETGLLDVIQMWNIAVVGTQYDVGYSLMVVGSLWLNLIPIETR